MARVKADIMEGICLYCGSETELNKKTGKPKKYCNETHMRYYRRNLRNHKFKKEHRCYYCGVKTKPMLVYPSRCKKHK